MNWYSYIATLGPIGYLPAQGSVATAVTIPLVYFLRMVCTTSLQYGLACALMIIFALIVTRKTLRHLPPPFGLSLSLKLQRNHAEVLTKASQRYDDPSEIVIDEAVGFLVTFVGIPWSVESVVLGFLIFRFFDIFKVAGISYVERLNGEWGIVLDDVCAGLLSNLVLQFIC